MIYVFILGFIQFYISSMINILTIPMDFFKQHLLKSFILKIIKARTGWVRNFPV